MDTLDPGFPDAAKAKKRRRTIKERRDIVEETWFQERRWREWHDDTM